MGRRSRALQSITDRHWRLWLRNILPEHRRGYYSDLSKATRVTIEWVLRCSIEGPKMSGRDLKDNHPNISPKLPRPGLASVVFGLLAILSVIGEFGVLLYGWSGHESWIVGFIFLLLPGTAIGLAISGIVLGTDGIGYKGSDRAFGVIGLLISLLTFPSCCLLFSFFCVASGGLMGF